VKDSSIQLREELTPEEITKYGSQQFLEHLAKKNSLGDIGFQHRDALFVAA
jgi:hypothetical protein